MNIRNVHQITTFIAQICLMFFSHETGIAQNVDLTFHNEKIVVPGAAVVRITSMNNQGHVVGWYRFAADPDRQARAFLWRDHQAMDLGILVYDMDHACSINDHDHIVGTFWSKSRDERAFLYEKGRTTRLQGVERATGINNQGKIANDFSQDRSEAKIVWDPKRIPEIDTSFIKNRHFWMWSINNNNQSVGIISSGCVGAQYACCWKGDTITILPTLGGIFNAARGINPQGTIVGNASTRDEREMHAVLWQNGKIKDLGLGMSEARAINSSGQIVGVAATDGHAKRYAFLYTKGGGRNLEPMMQMPPANHGTAAVAINDRGQIAINGDTWAVVLTPVKMANNTR